MVKILFLIGMIVCHQQAGAQELPVVNIKKPVVEPRIPTVVAGELAPEEKKMIDVFDRTAPSVVAIINAALGSDLFSLDVYEIPQGAGSGFVWDENGHIITNFHVVYGADKIEVILANKKSYEAQVVGTAPEYDLAVLKIDAPQEHLKPIPIALSGQLKVGQQVIAIGNPFGFDQTLTTGVVSALGRTIRSLTGNKIYDVIQTDAAINPGNSGGPVLDSFGRLIGVSTMIVSPSGANAGLGFAIPVDTVNQVVPQLISYGEVRRIGIGITLVPDNLRRSLGIQGAIVLTIADNTPAAKAGMRGTQREFLGNIVLGDIIIKIDDQDIKDNEDLTAYLQRNKKAGDEVTVEYIRDEKSEKMKMILEEL